MKKQVVFNPYTFAGIPRKIEPTKQGAKDVLAVVCKFYKTNVTNLKLRCKKREIVKPRQMVWLLMHEAGMTYRNISAHLGGFDRATVIHGVRTILNTKKHDEMLNAEYAAMHQQLFKPKLSDLLKQAS